MLPSDVTVLLPARNAAAFVEVAVRSVLADLGDAPIPIVVVDDASDDATPAILRELAANDRRVQVMAGVGRGLVAALEVGRRQVRTQLIARMDADDVWLPGRLAAQLSAIQADGRLAAVGGEVELVGEPSLSPGMLRYVDWLNSSHTPEELHRERYVESPLAHPAVLVRAEAVEEVGGYREGDFPEDYDLWLRLMGRGWKLANVAKRVLRWRDSAGRLTRTHPHYAPGAHRLLKVEHLLREAWIEQPVQIAGAGRTGLPLARALLARGVVVERFVEVHPRKVGSRIEGIPVVGYDALDEHNGHHLLVAVGIPEARQQVRDHLLQRSWGEGRDFTCVA